jgi:ATP-binding cassette subfamily F protein uup
VLYPGNYDDYRSAKKREREDAPQAAVAVEKAAKTALPQKKQGLSYKERIELERIMGDIEAAEGTLAALEKELEDPSLYAKRSAEVPGIVAKRDDAKREVERLVARWETLEALSSNA